MPKAAARGTPIRWLNPLPLLLLISALPAPALPRDRPVQPVPAVIVDGVVGQSEAPDAPSLREGDRVLAWRLLSEVPGGSPGVSGTAETPFHWRTAEVATFPRGEVLLSCERGGEALSISILAAKTRIRVRPQMTPSVLALYQEGKAAAKSGDAAAALPAWRRALSDPGARRDPALTCWLLLKIAQAAAAGKDIDGSLAALGEASAIADGTGPEDISALIYESVAEVLTRKNDLAGALEAYGKALALRERQDPGGLSPAWVLNEMCILARKLGDLDAAREHCGGALAIRERILPGSPLVAACLNNLGNVAWSAGDPDRAADLFGRALAIRERATPGSLDVASTLNNLGNVFWVRGDLRAAEEAHRKALAIREREAPGSADVAMSYNNMALVSFDRGDIASASDGFGRAAEIWEKRMPGSLQLATLHVNRGNIARVRGDLDSAKAYYERALRIQERIAPGGSDVALARINLGGLATLAGDLPGAESHFLECLAIRNKLAPGGTEVASALNNLATLEELRGNLVAALEYQVEAAAIGARVAPEGVSFANSLSVLADILAAMGERDAAEALYVQALFTVRAAAPGTADEAKALHDLGAIHEARGATVSALEEYREAVCALEEQRGKLGGGSEASEAFSAKYADYYRDLIGLQVRSGLPERAFEMLERFRAQTLVRMLAERDLDFSRDVPQGLLSEQGRVDAERRKVQEKLASGAAEGSDTEVQELRSRLLDLKERQRKIEDEIRRTSSRFASLKYPEPIRFAEGAAKFGRETLFLSYCTGPTETVLFALLDGRLEVHRIAVRREALGREVRLFRKLLTDPSTPAETLSEKARNLFGKLLAPAEAQIRRAGHIVICPDGPLHEIPFAALRGEGGKYLVEKKAISYAISATLLALSLKDDGTAQTQEVPIAAFGDPVYPLVGIYGTEAKRSVSDRMDLVPLPGTRDEVMGISELFGGVGRTFLGAAASEAEAKRLGPGTPLIHFACHGFFDTQFPLDSGLALSAPQEGGDAPDDGRLQAWEIFEGLRIQADLVTLSACETAAGKEMGGEGLVGLTRAFQFAGARSVLSSLWSVNDASTARLMKSLYGHIRAGISKDEALRLAQVDLIGTRRPRTPALSSHLPDWSHPFYWAAFVLNGESR